MEIQNNFQLPMINDQLSIGAFAVRQNLMILVHRLQH